MRYLYEKICNGDDITDQELDDAIEFFDDLDEKLRVLGPIFRLSSTEVNRVLNLLKGFKQARQEK